MEAIYQYLIVFITAIFVNNVVLSQILGICPFLGVSKKINTALGMSGAVAFVLVLATLVTYLLQYYVLNPLNLGYLQTIAFILVIAALVQLVEIILKKVSPSLYQALGIPTFDYYQLCRPRCGHIGYPKGIQSDDGRMVCPKHCVGLRTGFSHFRRHPRATQPRVRT